MVTVTNITLDVGLLLNMHTFTHSYMAGDERISPMGNPSHKNQKSLCIIPLKEEKCCALIKVETYLDRNKNRHTQTTDMDL